MVVTLISRKPVPRRTLLAVCVLLAWRMARAAVVMAATCWRHRPCDGDVFRIRYECNLDFSDAASGRLPRVMETDDATR